jgi:uncharacterized protein YegJ (DUF2314 family)
MSPFAWWRVTLLLVAGILMWLLWRTPVASAQPDEAPLLSLVLLFREPVYLEASLLAELASRAWGATIHTGGEEEQESVPASEQHSMLVGESPLFVCNHFPGLFTIRNSDEPFFDDVEAVAESVPELRRRGVIRDHRAWVAVDLVHWFGPEGESGRVQAYQMMGRLLAEMADDNCLAVFEPAEGNLFIYGPETEARLRGENPLQTLHQSQYAPVLAIAADDPQMLAAIAEARRRWPEFVAAFESRHEKAESPFLIKAPFSDREHTEYMWVCVTAIENDIIYGTLDNTPTAVRTVKPGDIVRIRLQALHDWLYAVDGKTAGGFSLKVLADKAKRHRGS